MKTTLIGIDLGTSSAKVVVIGPRGEVRGTASAAYTFDTPHPGWAEQDPHTWEAAVSQALAEAVRVSGIGPGEVAGIGLSGQMHSLVPLDAAGEPVRPAILWPDQRSQAQVDQVTRRLGKPRLAAWTANPLATGFTLASWLWMRKNEPELAHRTACLLLPKDYLRLRLTGVLGSEPSDASSTLLFDTAHRTWSRPLLEALDISPRLLPPLGESAGAAGELVTGFAHQTGLRPGTPVIFGGSDTPLQALGQGVTAPGSVSCAISTGGQLLAPLTEPRCDPDLRTHTFCGVFPGQWYLLAATLSAGLAFSWLRQALSPDLSFDDLAHLADEAGSSEGLFFLPHLAGERTPYMDPGSKGAFWGLSLRHTRAHLARAAMEGVIFSLRACLDLMVGLGVPVETVVASGGGAGHPFWRRLMADIFDRPVVYRQVERGSAYGAALLAGVGVGLFGSMDAALQAARPVPEEITRPDPQRAAGYAQAYTTFRQLYPALRSVGRGD